MEREHGDRHHGVTITLGSDRQGLPRSTGVPDDLRAAARRRLGWVALLFAFVFGGFVLLALALQLAGGSDRVGVVDAAAAALSAALFLLTRSRASDRTVTWAGLAFLALTVSLINFGNGVSVWTAHGHLPTVTFGSILIVAVPLIVPTTPMRTFVAVAVAALSAPSSAWALARWKGAAVVPHDYVLVSVVPLVSAVIAVFGARIVHGMTMQVAEARRLGAYRLVECIGRGGMGEVWRSEHALLARPAAIKLIRTSERAATENAIRRFEREAQVTASLCSPHTIQLYDFGVALDGTIYYVMELLHGTDLDKLVRKYGPQPAARVVYILRQMCHSLNEAHVAGLVHRDIKPANTFLCRYGQDEDFVKVLDFGLVTLQPRSKVPQADSLTTANSVQGTPAFMAPEAVLDPSQVGAPADIYALGCVAFWLLAGRNVFEADSLIGVFTAHVHEPPPRPSSLAVDVPADLEDLVMECLAKRSEDRPASVAALDERLARIAEATPWEPRRALLSS